MVASLSNGTLAPARPTPTSTPQPATSNSTVGSDGLSGVYWVGSNGNVYFQDNSGQVRDMGRGINGGAQGFDAASGSAQARRIDDPNAPSTPTSNNVSNNLVSSGSSGGGTVYPDLSGAIAILRQNISALDPIYQSEVQKAIQAYDTANNERQSTYNSTKAKSDATNLSNDQSVLTSRNAIDKNARVSSGDIMSILGALGMSGSTTDKAVGTIADKSNTDLNTANYGYGQNKQNILQAWNDFVNQDANQQKQLVDTKNYGIAQAGITRDTARNNALSQIASDMIQSGKTDTSGILGEIKTNNGDIANLSTSVKPTYTGITPTYTAPTIGSILGPSSTTFGVAGGGSPSATPASLVRVNGQQPSNSNSTKYGITT